MAAQQPDIYDGINLAAAETALRRQAVRHTRAKEKAEGEYARLLESCRLSFHLGLTKEAVVRASGLSRMTVYRALKED